MRVGRRFVAGLAVLMTGAGVLLSLATGTAVGDTPPGWEPEAGVAGSIAFYDANGTQVTGGDLSQHPATFFAVASGPGRSGDTKAQLKAFTPQVGVLPALWTGDTLTGATTYPNTSAPPDIAAMTVPVVSGASFDLSLADYISEFPNNLNQPGYTNLYELRIYTSAAGRSQDPTYFRADIQVTILGQDQNGEVTGLWNVVYPPTGGTSTPTPTPTDTATPTGNPTGAATLTDCVLTVSPNGDGPIGGTVTVTVTVTPTGVSGTVDLRDGRADLGAMTYTPGTGQATATLTPSAGTHVFAAELRPSNQGAFTTSDSVSVAFHVVDTVTPVTVTLVSSPQNSAAADSSGDAHFLLAAAVTPVGTQGEVHFFAGSSDLGTGSYDPSIGLATMNVAAPPGTTVFIAAFTPSDPTAFAAADSNPPLTFTITPATGGAPPVTTPTPITVVTPTTPAHPVTVPTTPVPTTPGTATPTGSPVPSGPGPSLGQPTATTTTVYTTPSSIGGALSLASRPTSLTAFVGMWVLLAATAVGALALIVRRNRRDTWNRGSRL